MKTIRSVLALAMLAVVALPLHGQQRQRMHQQGGMQGEQQGGMMMARMRAFAPATLLEQRGTLELTDDQVRQLTAIADEAKATYDEATATHERHQQALHEALMQDAPDEEAVLNHMSAAHAAMGLAHQTELRAALRARSVLTAEQRSAVPAPSPMGGQGMRGQGMQGNGMGGSQRQGCCNR